MWQPNLILDDGGDATHVLVKKFPSVVKQLKGIIEDSVTGVHRLYQLVKNGELSCPAMNVHDAVTRTMLNNFYSQKEALIDGLKVDLVIWYLHLTDIFLPYK
jgi:adenosylhomocysteinase